MEPYADEGVPVDRSYGYGDEVTCEMCELLLLLHLLLLLPLPWTVSEDEVEVEVDDEALATVCLAAAAAATGMGISMGIGALLLLLLLPWTDVGEEEEGLWYCSAPGGTTNAMFPFDNFVGIT